jgi:hypothetical protein
METKQTENPPTATITPTNVVKYRVKREEIINQYNLIQTTADREFLPYPRLDKIVIVLELVYVLIKMFMAYAPDKIDLIGKIDQFGKKEKKGLKLSPIKAISVEHLQLTETTENKYSEYMLIQSKIKHYMPNPIGESKSPNESKTYIVYLLDNVFSVIQALNDRLKKSNPRFNLRDNHTPTENFELDISTIHVNNVVFECRNVTIDQNDNLECEYTPKEDLPANVGNDSDRDYIPPSTFMLKGSIYEIKLPDNTILPRYNLCIDRKGQFTADKVKYIMFKPTELPQKMSGGGDTDDDTSTMEGGDFGDESEDEDNSVSDDGVVGGDEKDEKEKLEDRKIEVTPDPVRINDREYTLHLSRYTSKSTRKTTTRIKYTLSETAPKDETAPKEQEQEQSPPLSPPFINVITFTFTPMKLGYPENREYTYTNNKESVHKTDGDGTFLYDMPLGSITDTPSKLTSATTQPSYKNSTQSSQPKQTTKRVRPTTPLSSNSGAKTLKTTNTSSTRSKPTTPARQQKISTEKTSINNSIKSNSINNSIKSK